MNQTEYDYIFKIMLIGNLGVGKSSLLMRFAEDIFTDTFLPSIGIDFKIRTIQSAETRVKLEMWDTVGQEKYKSVLALPFKGIHGLLMVFDITDRTSFTDLKDWLAETEKHCGEKVVRILIGNKKDIEDKRQVMEDEGKNWAENLGMIYFETSAKEGLNIEESFISLVIEMKKTFKPFIHRSPSSLNLKHRKNKPTCC